MKDEASGIRAIAGLLAVVAGIAAVCLLAAIALTRFGSNESDSVVAVTTSGFGIISAVVGAYLGIKTAGSATENAKEAVHVSAKAGEEEISDLQAAMGEKLSDDDHKNVLAAAAKLKASRRAAGG